VPWQSQPLYGQSVIAAEGQPGDAPNAVFSECAC